MILEIMILSPCADRIGFFLDAIELRLQAPD
jgi:hypothetical protein